MNHFSKALALCATGSLLLFACTKIGEPTEIGDDLIPAVDNITTFEQVLATQTDLLPLTDTARMTLSDNAAIGYIQDPTFGNTQAEGYLNFSLTPSERPFYPFVDRDSVTVDSVVVSLAYRSSYGDTTAAQTFRVFEIDTATSTFTADSFYRFDRTPFPVMQQLGSATFRPRDLNDSTTVVRNTDPYKVANVLRIRLNNDLGERFVSFDTAAASPRGAYNNNQKLQSLFRGLAIRSEQTGNALSYFSFADTATHLTVYFRVVNNGKPDTLSTVFRHGNSYASANPAQANIITRTPAGDYAATLASNDTQEEELYIQSPSNGSFASVRIPGLDTFSNKLIHRAELIVARLPAAGDNLFTPGTRLLLDKISPAGDSAMLFLGDLIFSQSGQPDYAGFGSLLRIDNTYRFNITRYVQSVVTRGVPNYTLRLYSPYVTRLYTTQGSAQVTLNGTDDPARGRIKLAGGNYAQADLRLRLRIIYSNL